MWGPLQLGKTPTMWLWLVFDSLLYGIIIQRHTFLQTQLSQLQKWKRTRKISTSHFFLGYLFDSRVIFFETMKDGCIEPPSTDLGIETKVCQLIYGKPESSFQATVSPRPISQLFIFLRNNMRQMFIQIVDQPGCFVLSLAMWPFHCLKLPLEAGLGQGEKLK